MVEVSRAIVDCSAQKGEAFGGPFVFVSIKNANVANGVDALSTLAR